jgi:two-component system response regulator
MHEPIILLVEDNADDVELTRHALRECQCASQLVVMRDGKEALDWLFQNERHQQPKPHALPAVVLLDLKLPKVNGLEVLQRMRNDPRTRRLPVVVLTSSTEEPDMQASYDLGANSYIQKPVDYAHFLEAVRQLGIYWTVLNEVPPAYRTSA